MTDRARDLRPIRRPHGAADRAAGTAVSERTARADRADAPSDDEIRRKAYECWEARGRVHGRDQEDWFEALAALRRPALPDGAPIAGPGEPATDLLSAGMRAAGSMMLSAAHALDDLLGIARPKKDPD